MSNYLHGKRPDEGINLKEAVVEWIMQRADSLLVHNVSPAVGSIVYCHLAVAVEHSGIYVGNKQIVHLNGDGRIEIVSPMVFCKRLHGKNPASMIFCPMIEDGKLIGSRRAAEYALRQVGKHIDYNLFKNNCHKFSVTCMNGRNEECPSFKCLEELIENRYGEFHWRATDLTR